MHKAKNAPGGKKNQSRKDQILAERTKTISFTDNKMSTRSIAELFAYEYKIKAAAFENQIQV